VYLALNTVVSLVVIAAAVEAVTGLPGFGLDSETVSASNQSTKLEVEYPKVTRGQLVSSLQITVNRDGGFDEPVLLAISADYLDPFITQGATPEPDSETADDSDVIMTFDAPPGDTFIVRWNLTAQPIGMFKTISARVAFLSSDQTPIVSVDFDTKLRP